MLENNSIVFNQSFGFGVIKEVNDKNKIAYVFFYSYGLKKIAISRDHLVLVSKEDLNSIINSKVEDFFDNKTVKNAESNIRRIQQIAYKDGLISGIIIVGNRLYKQNVRLHGEKINFLCSCDSKIYCAHEAAIYMKTKMIFESLLSEIEFFQIDTELYNCISSVGLVGDRDQNILKICDYLTNDLNLNNLIVVFKLIDRNIMNNSFSEKDNITLVKSLIFNKPIYDILNSNRDKFLDLSYEESIDEALNIMNNANILDVNDNSDNILYYFFNNELKTYIIESFRYFYYRYSLFVNIACKEVNIDEELFDALRKYLFDYDGVELYKPLIDRLSYEQTLLLLKDESLELRFEDLDRFSKKEKIELIPYIDINPYDVDAILHSGLLDELDDLSKAKIVFNFIKSDLSTEKNRKVYFIIKKMKKSKYLVEYLNNYKRYNPYRYYAINLDYSLIDKEEFTIKDDEFFTYFKEDFNVNKSEENIEILYEIKSLNGDIVICVECSDDEYFIRVNNLDDKFDSVYARYAINYIRRKHSNEIIEKYNEVKKEIELEKDHKKSLIACQEIKALNAIKKDQILLKDKKACLEYFFDCDYNYGYRLSLKVGINKMYIVKDIREFIYNFRKEINHEYGKGFSLTHSLDNFRDIDASIIRELLKTNISADKKYLYLSEDMFINLFENLQGNIINYDAFRYRLNLDKFDLKFIIDKDYRIQIEGEQSFDMLLFTSHKIFVLNKEKQTIDYIDVNYRESRIIEFLYKNIGTNIQPLLENFKDTIYYDYCDKISINSNVKDDFKMANVNIKTYFDYEDSIISCVSKYYLDDKEISFDKIKEQYNIAKINRYQDYLNSIGVNDGVIEKDGDILNFFLMDFGELKNQCEVYLSNSIQNKKVSYFTPSKIDIRCNSTIMEAFMEESQYSDDDLYKILAAIKKKKKFVVMQDDRIINIANDEAVEFSKTVSDLGLNKKKLSEKTNLSIANALKALAHENSCNIDDYLLNMINDISNFKNADIKIPPLEAKLRNYQKDGYNWLSILSKYQIGGILADDMGLGKTLEMIALITSDNSPCPNLIVCPKSVVFNWVNEFRKFSSNEKVLEIYGTKKQREDIINSIKQDEKATYIVSYDSLRNDIEMYNKDFNYMVLDEAQYIKNVAAQKTHNVKRINAKHRFALTGTPIENNIVDLWSIFDFVIPSYLENIDEFRSNYNSDENYAQIISKRVAPFILRRNKKDVLSDLPDKYEHIVSAEMSEMQRQVYDAYVKQAKDRLNEGLTAFQILPYLMRLRQICIDPRIFIENYEGDSGKMIMLKQIVDDYVKEGHRIMIVSQFVQALNEVENILHNLNIPYFMITGSIDAKKRMSICDSFNNNSKEKVVLVSLKAGGTGINLIGADTVIHLDPWWNIAATDQATDRTYRIGQKRNVEVIKLICEKSIEQRVIELQNAKKDLIDKVISNDESSVVNASIDDIKFILE